MIARGSHLDHYLRPGTLEQIRARVHTRNAFNEAGALAQARMDREYLLREVDRLSALLAHGRWRRVHQWDPVVDEPVLLRLTGEQGRVLLDVGIWSTASGWRYSSPGVIQRIARIHSLE